MRKAITSLCLPLLLTVAGCGGPEPFERPGTWRATGANEANLRAMVVEPGHLTRGVAPLAAARGERAAIAGDYLGRTAAQAAGGGAGGPPGGGMGTGAAGGMGGGQAAAPQGGIPPLPPPQGANNGRR